MSDVCSSVSDMIIPLLTTITLKSCLSGLHVGVAFIHTFIHSFIHPSVVFHSLFFQLYLITHSMSVLKKDIIFSNDRSDLFCALLIDVNLPKNIIESIPKTPASLSLLGFFHQLRDSAQELNSPRLSSEDSTIHTPPVDTAETQSSCKLLCVFSCRSCSQMVQSWLKI